MIGDVDPAILIAVISAVAALGGSVFAWLAQRKSRALDLTDVLEKTTASVLTLHKPMRERIDRQEEEITKLRGDLRAALEELHAAQQEIARLRLQIGVGDVG